jgi:hypothetical protein
LNNVAIVKLVRISKSSLPFFRKLFIYFDIKVVIITFSYIIIISFIKNRFDKSSIKVSNDSNIMWHIEYSKDSVHEYRVDTKQAAGEKGVDDYNKKKYGSVVNKIQTK